MDTKRLNCSCAHLGFTLIESLVVIAITATLLSVALPSFNTMVRKFRTNAVVSSLAANLQQARSEAIKANRRVLVCATNAAADSCNQSTDWAQNGWLVCYDINGNGRCDTSTASLPNPILVTQGIDADLVSVTGPATSIRFNPDGTQGAAGVSTVDIAIRGTWSGAPELPVSVTASGQVKVTKP